MPTQTAIRPAAPLTAEDLTAMKRAEEVSLHLNPGQSILRLYTRGQGAPVIYTAAQQRLFADETNFNDRRARDIHVSASAMGYGNDDSSTAWYWNSVDGWRGEGQVRPPSCFYSVYQTDVWRTVVASLRVGDTLHLEWVADNNNGHSREVGLHVDEVRLKAMGPVRTLRSLVRTWQLGWQVGQDNSARMIRRFG